MTRTASLLTLLALSSTAQAFCGYYAGSVGNDVFNYASEAALVRQGTRTTITLKNDFQGVTSDFALVLPVPIVLQEGDVRVVDEQLFYRLDAWSAPREVYYECPRFSNTDSDWADDSGSAVDSADASADSDAPPPVIVENEFIVGDYEIVILSAQDSAALVTWLTTNGYAVSSNAEDLLGEYISAGMFFFAAKVTAPAVDPGGEPTFLAPLQFSFDAPELMLPIRLGTLNSQGEQDLVVYVINDPSDGRVEVSNYDEASIEDECMWPADAPGQTVSEYYAARFSEAWDAHTSPLMWVTEYGWATSWCDPCATPTLTNRELEALGWDDGAGSDTGEDSGWNSWNAPYDAYLTRLHLRYESTVPEDLMFTLTGSAATTQTRFIRYDHQLEATYPVCGLGMVANPGTCPDDTGDTDWRTDTGRVEFTSDPWETGATDECNPVGCTDTGFSGDVCGADGVTYWCKDIPNCLGITWTEGACEDGPADTDTEGEPVTDVGEPTTDSPDTGLCSVCMDTGTGAVCGDDGVTYACGAIAICEGAGSYVQGACPGDNATDVAIDPRTDTDGGAPEPDTGREEIPHSDVLICDCDPGLEPVCGDDGVTYDCGTEADCAGVLYRSGACEDVVPTDIPDECDSCPDTATPPVCGENGVTYACWYIPDCLGITWRDGDCDSPEPTDPPDPGTDTDTDAPPTDSDVTEDPDPSTDTDEDPEATDTTDTDEATDTTEPATDITDVEEPTVACSGCDGSSNAGFGWLSLAALAALRRRR